MVGNDTIDRYPPAFGKVEKILATSDKVFKKIVKDFEAFFSGKLKANQKSLIIEPNKGQINGQKSSLKQPKLKTKSNNQIILPYGAYEPSDIAQYIGHCRNHRVSRVNDWHSTYGQGMYE